MDFKRMWERARGHYHYPALDRPKSVPKFNGGAAYNFQTRETLVSEAFVEQTSTASGLSEDEVLEGIFVHEIGHYMVFPRTLGTIVLAANMIDVFFDKEDQDLKTFIFQTYADMATDTASVLHEAKTEPILKLRQGLQKEEKDKLNYSVRAVMLAYLEHQAQREFQLEEELQPFFERMREIDFLNEDVEKMRQGIWTFGNIIVDMMKKYPQPPGSGGQDGQGESSSGFGIPGQGKGEGLGGFGVGEDSDPEKMIQEATEGDMRQAIREISPKITKKELDRIKEWLKDKGANIPPAGSGVGGEIKSIGISDGQLPVDQDTIDYYYDLSMHLPIIVTKKLLETDASTRTWNDTEKWRPGSDPNLVLPASSGGLLLPGVTRSILIGERPIKTHDYKVPHLLIVIDSSGSMPDPKHRKSYGVLGGYCAARSYHLHGSYVGVINFSGSSFYLPYTRELNHALGAISAYQGGGTVADVDMIRKMLGPEMAELYRQNPERNLGSLPREAIKKELTVSIPEDIFATESLDVIMFTDGGIANLNEVLEFFKERAELNRATIVLAHGFEQEIADMRDERINIHRIENDKDIPELIIKEIPRNFNLMLEGLRR